jgi:hypothetical protein
VSLKQSSEQFPSDFSTAWLDKIDESFSLVKSQFEITRRGKTSLVSHWYQPLANTLRDIFEQTDLLTHYDDGYTVLS